MGMRYFLTVGEVINGAKFTKVRPEVPQVVNFTNKLFRDYWVSRTLYHKVHQPECSTRCVQWNTVVTVRPMEHDHTMRCTAQTSSSLACTTTVFYCQANTHQEANTQLKSTKQISILRSSTIIRRHEFLKT